MVREFTVSIHPSPDFYGGNRQDVTEVQFCNIARLIVGPLVTSHVRHVIGAGWRLHRKETMSWPVPVQSRKQMRNTGCEIRTVRGVIEIFRTKILQRVPSLWFRVHCQGGEFLFCRKTETSCSVAQGNLSKLNVRPCSRKSTQARMGASALEHTRHDKPQTAFGYAKVVCHVPPSAVCLSNMHTWTTAVPTLSPWNFVVHINYSSVTCPCETQTRGTICRPVAWTSHY
jgi:hypothetical protein